MSREETIRILVTYPAVVGMLDTPQPGEPDSRMLILRLRDEQMTGTDPRLVGLAHTDEPKTACIARVHRAMDITSASGEAGKKGLEVVVPLVRSADYFITQGQLAPTVIGWLTEFIGLRLATDESTILCMVSESDLSGDRIVEYDIEFRDRAIGNLRLVGETMAFSEMGFRPDALTLTIPPGNEAVWFADVATMEELLGRLDERTGTTQAVIPARRSNAFLVNVVTDCWGDLLDDPEETVVARDSIRPLPHVVANRRWQLSLPPRTSQLGQCLQRLRQRAEGRTYNVLKDAIRKDYDHYMSSYENPYALDNELFSMVSVPEGAPGASIPVVDVIALECGHLVLDVPYTKVVGQLPHLVKPHSGTYPSWVIVARPSKEGRARLGSLTFRGIPW